MEFRLKLIENWKVAYKYVSVQLAALMAILVGLEPFVPQMAAYLPVHWQVYLSLAILVSRIVKQASVSARESHVQQST